MKSKIIRATLAILPWLMAVVVVAILLQRYPVHQLVASFRHANTAWFILYSVAYFLLVWCLDCVSLSRLFLGFGFTIPLQELMRFRLASYLPMLLGFGVGQGFLAYFFKKKGNVPFFIGSSLMLFIFFVDLYWTFTLAFLGSFIVDLTVAGVDLSHAIRLLWTGVTAASLFFILFCKFPPDWKVVSWIRTRDIFHSFHRARVSDYGVTAILRLPIHLAVNTTLFFIAPIFGASLPFVNVMAVQPVITLIGAIPLTPGGIGTVQLATAEFFRDFVANPSLLVSMSLLFMATNYALRATAGLFFIKWALRFESEPEVHRVGSARKVVFVVNNFLIGGAERVTERILDALKGRFDVSVICVCGSSPKDSELAGEGIPFYYGDSYGASESLWYKLLWVLRSPLIFYKTLRIILSLRPDVVVTSLYQADIIGGFSAQLLGIPQRILIQHDHEPMGWLVCFLKKRALAFSSHVVANSQATATFLTRYWKVPAPKITVILNGIPQERFRNISRMECRRGSDIRMGAIGRLQPIKGMDCLLEAAAMLKEDGLLPAIDIVGSGSHADALKKMASDRGLSHVQFFSEMQDPASFFERVDVVVVPSLREGFGLVALEALLSGKCVVASDIPSFRTLITHGQNGLLFPPNDAAALAQYLKRIILEPALTADLRRGVAAWVAAEGLQYDSALMVKHYANLIGEG